MSYKNKKTVALHKLNNKKLLIIISDAKFFNSHRLPIALTAMQSGFNISVACPNSPHTDKFESLGIQHIPITNGTY